VIMKEESITVSICKCTRVVFAAVSYRLDEDDVKLLGQMAVDGYSILTITRSEYDKLKFGCKCTTGD